MTKWIFVCGMRRSGTLFRYQIVKEIIGESYCHGWMRRKRFLELFYEVDEEDEYAVVKTHVFFPRFLEEARYLMNDNRLHAIYSYRDVRDVAASLKKFRPELWSHADRPERDISSIMEEFYDWHTCPIKLDSKYEIMVEDPASEVMRISEFLGKPMEMDECQEIAEKYSIENNRKRQKEKGGGSGSLMWYNHVDTGKVGRWRDELSQGEINVVYKVAGKWLQDMGYVS